MAFGSAPALIVSAGVGAAAATALEPAFEVPRQEAWARIPNKVLDPGTLARLVARGGVLLGEPGDKDGPGAYAEALRQGYTADKLDRLIYLSQTFPGSGELDHLSNRQFITEKMVDEALTRSGLPPEWHAPVKASFQDILSPGELAAAVHRGLVPDQGLLLGEQPAPPFKVEAYPVQPIDAIKEAAGSGYDEERLQVLVGLQGLPMGPHEAAQALFRGIITHGDYIRAFNTSNMRNEWAQAILDQTRQIPTARDFMENALRGHHDFDWAAQQAERHGMSRDDAFLIYQNQGRPLNLHQITQAEAWGAKYNPGPGDNPDPWMQSVLLGAVRPEYYEMQDSLKYNLPSAFNFRALQEQQVITESEAETWYKRLGWPPELAKQVAAAYAKPAAATTKENPWLAKAQGRFWTDAQNAYIKDNQTRIVIEPYLENLVPDTVTRDLIFQWWDNTRVVTGHAPPTPIGA